MRKQAAMRALPAAVTAVIAAATVAGLAACGSSSKRPTATTPITPSSSATQTVTETVTTGATSTTPSTAPGTPPPCGTADFTPRFLGQEGATGHGELGFALKNATSHQCRTYGYPGVQFLDKAGAALPTTPTHTTTDFFGTTSKLPLTVLPGATVSFRLGVTHGADGAPCSIAYALQVIAPDDTHRARIAIPGGATECGGTVTVSPLQADVTAFGQ